MTKRKVTACLLAGVLVLAVSAGAAFDSVNGYATFKNGVKSLALQTDNVTLQGRYSAEVDGKEIQYLELEAATDGTNSSSHEKSKDAGGVYESWNTTADGKHISFRDDMKAKKQYYGYDVEQSGFERQNLMSIDTDEELARRMVTFFELAADTVMGDLKNNFVSLGKEDGISRYQVDISKEQVPAVINAGLSLLAYTQSQTDYYTSSMVDYEDFAASFAIFYEQQTGHAMSSELEAFFAGELDDEDWVEANQDLIDEVNEIRGQYYEGNYNELEEKGNGVLLVKADNTRIYYENSQQYYEAIDSDRLIRFVGEDAALQTASCTFGVDEKGRLSEVDLTATFTSTDVNGKTHTLVAKVGGTASDYGTTTVQLPDVTGWTNVYNDTADTVPETENAIPDTEEVTGEAAEVLED